MTDKEKYLEFWGYTLGTPEAEEAWEAKVKMMTGPRVTSAQVMGDQHYEGLCATDGTDISTRAKHRAYMRENGLSTIDDYKDTFAKAQESRDAYRSGQQGSISRRDIERAISQLTGY